MSYPPLPSYSIIYNEPHSIAVCWGTPVSEGIKRGAHEAATRTFEVAKALGDRFAHVLEATHSAVRNYLYNTTLVYAGQGAWRLASEAAPKRMRREAQW